MTKIRKAVMDSWWVILFSLGCLGLLERGLHQRDQDVNRLTEQLNALMAVKNKEQIEQEHLMLQINSESDPAWIELVLMYRLGLTPEEQTKVFFRSDAEITSKTYSCK